MNLSLAVDSPLPPAPASSVELAPTACDAPPSEPAPRAPASSSLSGFAREAIREKAERELAALRASLDAFDHLLAVRDGLAAASVDLTALLGGLSAIAADGATIGRAKKLRKLLDEASDGADALVDATAVAQRRTDAEEKKRMLLSELEQAGIVLSGAC